MRPLVSDLVRRWFAVVGGPVAYTAVIVGGFWLVPVACATTGTWLLHVLMALALVLATVSLAVAGMLRRAAPPPPPPPEPPPPGTGGLLHLLGVFLQSTRLALAGLLWSAASGGPSAAEVEHEPAAVQRRRDMAAVGIALGVISVILIVFHWAPVFVLEPCA